MQSRFTFIDRLSATRPKLTDDRGFIETVVPIAKGPARLYLIYI
jgi:hypothetical protein